MISTHFYRTQIAAPKLCGWGAWSERKQKWVDCDNAALVGYGRCEKHLKLEAKAKGKR